MQKQNSKKALIVFVIALLIGLFFGRSIFEKLIPSRALPSATLADPSQDAGKETAVQDPPALQPVTPDLAQTTGAHKAAKKQAKAAKANGDDPAPKGTVFFDEKSD